MSATKRPWSATFTDEDDGGAEDVHTRKSYCSYVDDDDDEEPTFGRQTLPVARLPDDFNGTPTDGMQYLFTVR